MRRLSLFLFAAIAGMVLWAADWPTESGSPQREGWARAEKAFTKENVKGLELLYKYKAANQTVGADALTTPMIVGRIITYLGFKEMLVFGGSADNVFSVDDDLNRLIWKKHFDSSGARPAESAVCPGGLTAPIAMAGSSTAIGRGRFTPGRAGGNRSGEFYAVGGDGNLHVLNTSTGEDRMPPMKFLPANAKVSGLNVDNNVVYAATLDKCGGNPNALYALDLAAANAAVASFPTHGGSFAGVAGSAIGADGTVYTEVQNVNRDSGDPPNDTVFALTTKTLALKDFFAPATKPDVDSPGVTPVVFQWKGREVIVAGDRDGHVYLLDSKSLGGADHHTPLAQTQYITNGGFRGAFSSWEDADGGTRWVYASSGSFVVGMKVEEVNGQPALTQVWKSKDMIAPAPVVTANGLVFVLATGDARRANNHAILYALNAATGDELYSSGNAAATWTHNSGLAIANNRIYFTTHDNLVYCFGFFAQQPQLTGK